MRRPSPAPWARKRRAAGLLLAGAALAVPAARAQPARFDVVHAFQGAEGYATTGQLVRARDGNFYGTNDLGGAAGLGTVFRVTPDGVLTVLHAFTGLDGAEPAGGLAEGPDGRLYGATTYGGPFGRGTVFLISTAGHFERLHAFSDLPSPAHPWSQLVVSPQGELFGTTTTGGSHDGGTVFAMDRSGQVRVLHSFDMADPAFSGTSPRGLLLTPDGLLVGVAATSGASPGCTFFTGCGGVFTLSTDGRAFHGSLFRDGLGANPEGAPILASDGNLYGTAQGGGDLVQCHDQGGCGTIWRLVPDGRLQAVHRFHGIDGTAPAGRLLQASDGNLYGTTVYGGTAEGCHVELGCGVVFRLSAFGGLRVVHRFELADGIRPWSGLVEAPDGALYGTTSEAGAAGMGTVFEIQRGPPAIAPDAP
jgi:uncharacterized repeat protein (TIGR03803 family)